MEDKKIKFLKVLENSMGVVAVACKAISICRSTYYNWLKSDSEFKEKADEIIEMQIDAVESSLLNNIKNGDTTATIFYLKTKGKERGYSEKIAKKDDAPKTESTVMELPVAEKKVTSDRELFIKRKIYVKKSSIIKRLKDEGKYTKELSEQVDIVATLQVRWDMIKNDVFSDDYKIINTEYSREGNERIVINPKEKLFQEYSERYQKALRALGMNTDSNERKTSEDGLSNFMSSLNDDRG